MRSALCALIITASSVSGAASEPDCIIGADAADGTAFLVKKFQVSSGSIITGLTFWSNEEDTVFPKVLLVQGGMSSIAEGTTLHEWVNVSPADGHGVTLTCPPISVLDSEELAVCINLPASPGLTDGRGPGIAAVQVDEVRDSFFTTGATGALGGMDVEYEIRLSTESGKAVGVNAAERNPPVVSLDAHPNPSNPSFVLRLTLPKTVEVTVDVYDVSGRHVRSIVRRAFTSAGTHSFAWDGTNDRGSVVAAGIYLLKLQTGTASLTKKIVLTK